MQRWTERYPGRLEYEVEAFRAEGLDFELDEDEMSRSGRVVFRGTLVRDGRAPIELEVRYPELFPFFRPEVFAPQESFPRHQGLYRKNLCLLDRATDQWLTNNTGAWLVSVRVPYLLNLLEGEPEAMREAEAPQGEPFTTYLPLAAGAVVFIPGELGDAAEEEQSGDFVLSTGEPEQSLQGARSCLFSLNADITGGRSNALAAIQEPLKSRFPERTVKGRWVRLAALPAHPDPASLLAAIRQSAGYRKPMPATQPVPGVCRTQPMRWYGVVIKDEVEQGVWEDTWFFLATQDKPAKRGVSEEVVALIRGERLSRKDLAARIPTISGLQEKVVALIGLGALGAPLALELLRAQVGELRILDCDFVSGGTIVRWPQGLTAVGHIKTELIEGIAKRDYPFTQVKSYMHRLGMVFGEGEPEERPATEVLDELLDGVDMVIDATAELGVRHLLSSIADEQSIPQVYVSATQGGWGGVVARVVPGETGCWWCLQTRLAEGSIEDAPSAPEGTGTVQAHGCGSRTWTGASFDALPLVAQAARVACFTLVAGRSPDSNDVFVCSQPAADATELSAPTWASYPLTKHPDCACSREEEAVAA